MHPQKVLLGDWRWTREFHVGGVRKTVGDEAEFPDRHDVLADRRSVTRMKEGGQHWVGGTSGIVTAGRIPVQREKGVGHVGGRNCGP